MKKYLNCFIYITFPGVQAYLAGLTFALAASPCSTPVLATLLGYVASTRVFVSSPNIKNVGSFMEKIELLFEPKIERFED